MKIQPVNVMAVKLDSAKVGAAPRPTGECPTRNQMPSSSFDSQLAARLEDRLADHLVDHLADRLVDRGGVDLALRRAPAANNVSRQVRRGHVRPAVFGPFDAPRPSALAWPSRVAAAFANTSTYSCAITRARTLALARSKDPLWGEFTSFLVVVALIAVTFFV